MKIIKHGENFLPAGWWVGKKFKCKCGAQIQLEENDPVKEIVCMGAGIVKYYHFQCPDCFQFIWITP